MSPLQGKGFAILSSTAGRHALELAQRHRLVDHVGIRILCPDGLSVMATWGEGAAEVGEPILGRIPDVSRPAGNASDLPASTGSRLPPFACARWSAERRAFVIASDWLGFLHLYAIRAGDLVAISSSASLLARLIGASLDARSFAVQSLLGWQLGLRTPFASVTKLPPGCQASIGRGQLDVDECITPIPERVIGLDGAAAGAARRIRATVEAHIDEQPDIVLQLTGGHDSRILLAAIPPSRRSSVHAMTLGVPDSSDARIARDLATREGMPHAVVGLDGLEALTPHEAFVRCIDAAHALVGSADPVAHAVLTWAESKLDQRPRLSGLGGEVARGFYYAGPTWRFGVHRKFSAILADWRMLANDAVQAEAMADGHADHAHAVAVADIHDALTSYSTDWWTATDEFYLWQRMQRWAGVLASAIAGTRSVVNPMLDREFIDTARALPPSAKANMRFLSRILLALDEDLATIPMDNRPPPRVYATPTVTNRARLAGVQLGRVKRKAQQRLTRATHPPAGGTVLAMKVIEHLRADPSAAGSLVDDGAFDNKWLDRMLAGDADATPATVSLMLNRIAAREAIRPPTG